MNSSTIVGRFAPSPSGPLHFGSLVAALGSWVDARSRGGTWLLRIEDIDPPRERKGARDQILFQLESAGLWWDGDILLQSNREEAYDFTLKRLEELGILYPCNCTRAELRDSAVSGPAGPVYPGRCRDGMKGSRTDHAIRIRVPDERILFTERNIGKVTHTLATETGDFVLRRADGLTAYQLAVVVDDAFQGVTSVVRGSDLLSSTPRQIHLQQLLGCPTPEYLHLPLVLDRQGRKLSKSNRDTPWKRGRETLSALREAWSFLGQLEPPQEILCTTDFLHWACEHWSTERLPPLRQPVNPT